MHKGPVAQGSMKNSRETKLKCLDHGKQGVLWGEMRLEKESRARRRSVLQAPLGNSFAFKDHQEAIKGLYVGDNIISVPSQKCYEYETIFISQLNEGIKEKKSPLGLSLPPSRNYNFEGQGFWGSVLEEKLIRLTSRVLSSPDIYFFHSTFLPFWRSPWMPQQDPT